jgi:hypothetical protein
MTADIDAAFDASVGVGGSVNRDSDGDTVSHAHNEAAATSSKSGPSGVQQIALTTSDLVIFKNEVTMGGEYDGHLKCSGDAGGADDEAGGGSGRGGDGETHAHNEAAATSSKSGPSGVQQIALTTSDLVPFKNEVTMGGEYDGHLKCGGGKSGATKAVTGSAPEAFEKATPSSGSIDGV